MALFFNSLLVTDKTRKVDIQKHNFRNEDWNKHFIKGQFSYNKCHSQPRILFTERHQEYVNKEIAEWF